MLETYVLIKPKSRVFVEGYVTSSAITTNNTSSYTISFGKSEPIQNIELKFKKDGVYDLNEIVKLIPSDILIEEIKERKLKF
jgi:hypothetical protein